MLKSILATTDMSARGDLALHRAIALARQHGAELTVLSVIDDATTDEIVAAQRDLTEKMLTRFATKISGDVKCDVQVIAGDPTEAIIAAAKDHDLMVMGTHRPRNFLAALRETTAQRITRLSRTSVLVAVDSDCKPYDQVIVGVDFSPTSTAAIMQAAALAPDAPVTPFNAMHVPYKGRHGGDMDTLIATFEREARQFDADWRRNADLPERAAATQIIEGSVMGILEDAAKKAAAPLIAVGAHGRVGQGRALLGTVSCDLMRNPVGDLLIARRPKNV